MHYEHEQFFKDSLFHHRAVPQQVQKGAAELSHITYGFVPYWERTYNCPRWDLVSRIAYFDCTIDSDGSITDTHYWYSASVVDDALANGVAVDLCIAQFTNSTINALISSASARANGIHNSIEAMLARGGTGINIDFEYPSSGYGDEFVTFMAEFRDSLDARGPGYWLSVCLPDVDWGDAYYTDQLKNYCNAMFIMAYGCHWSGSAYTGAVDPLDDPTESWDIAYSVNHYVTQSGAPEKIVLGLPAYGYDWPCDGPDKGAATTGSGSATLYINAIAHAETYGRLWDTDATSPWYRYSSWHQCWYSDSTSLEARYAYAKAQGLQGVGWWALGYDDGDPAFWGAVEEQFSMGDTSGIIVDDGDHEFNCDLGNWSSGAYPDSGWENDYLWCDATDTIENWARWTPYIPDTGAYDISIWWMPATNRCDSVFIRVWGASNDSFFVSQKTGDTEWHYIGRFLFDEGYSGYVGISDRSATSGDVVIADAVRWIYIGSVDTIVDDLDPTFYHYGDSVWWREVDGGYDGHFYWTNSTSHSYDVCYGEWHPVLPKPAEYEVFVYIPETNAEADAKYRIFHAYGEDTIIIDQSTHISEWVSLGTYYFTGAAQEKVYLGDATGTTGENIAFDAMAWRSIELSISHKEPAKPEHFSIFAYPNPFNSSCKITLSGVNKGACSLVDGTVEIYDLRGNVVNGGLQPFVRNSGLKPAVDTTTQPSANHTFIWTPDKTIASGIYLIQARTEDGQTTSKKIVYLR